MRTKKPMTKRLNIWMDEKSFREISAKAKTLNIDLAEAARRALNAWAQKQDPRDLK